MATSETPSLLSNSPEEATKAEALLKQCPSTRITLCYVARKSHHELQNVRAGYFYIIDCFLSVFHALFFPCDCPTVMNLPTKGMQKHKALSEDAEKPLYSSGVTLKDEL